MNDSTRYEQSKLGQAELNDVILTTAAVSVVVGIVLGLVSATKPVMKGVAIALGTGGAVGAATYLLLDYRHVNRRNALQATIQQVTAENTQLRRDREQAVQTMMQLQAELNHAQTQFNQLADVAEHEQAKLQAQLDAAITARSSAIAAPTVPAVEAAMQPLLPQDPVPIVA